MVMNVPSGNGGGVGRPLYFNAYGAAGAIIHNRALNLPDVTGANAVYGDSWDQNDLRIIGNQFDNVACGIKLVKDNWNMTNVVIKDNVIMTAEGGTGIAYQTSTGHGVENLFISGNYLAPANPGAINVSALSLNASGGYIHATVMNNVFQGAGAGYDFFVNWPESPANDAYPHSLQLKTWLNNVNLAGTQLTEVTNLYWRAGDGPEAVNFTPAAAGWYRVMMCGGAQAAEVHLYSEGWNNSITDIDFWFHVNSWEGNTNLVGELAVNRRGSAYSLSPGNVSAARIVAEPYPSTALYLDIHVPVVTADVKQIRVKATGMLRGTLLSSPVLITTTPPLYKELEF
jgi:hypothetical protein